MYHTSSTIYLSVLNLAQEKWVIVKPKVRCTQTMPFEIIGLVHSAMSNHHRFVSQEVLCVAFFESRVSLIIACILFHREPRAHQHRPTPIERVHTPAEHHGEQHRRMPARLRLRRAPRHQARGRTSSQDKRCTLPGTVVCSCTPRPSYVSIMSSVSPHPHNVSLPPDRARGRGHIRRGPAVPHVLRRDGFRRHTQGRHGQVRGGAACARRGCAADQGALQRGQVRRAALDVHPAAEVRERPARRDEPRILPREEQLRQRHHRHRNL